MHPRLHAELAISDGVVLRRARPDLDDAITRAHRSGELVRILPGAYLATALSNSLPHRLLTLARYDPSAIITGTAAAARTWWPETSPTRIVAYRSGHCRPVPGFCWDQGNPPDGFSFRFGGLLLAAPALQVLDLIPELGATALDEALRRRAVSVSGLRHALAATPGRSGNRLRSRLIHDSRDEPWSPAERDFHEVLRRGKIRGWRSNHRVHVGDRTYYLDVGLPWLRLAFEIDGFEFHSARAAFERDRLRDAQLAGAGWQVIRISAVQVPDCLPLITRAIAARSRQMSW
jgi:very-short-patch-repair endonuclease